MSPSLTYGAHTVLKARWLGTTAGLSLSLIVLALHTSCKRNESFPTVVKYWRDEITTEVGRRGIQMSAILTVRRDAFGTNILVIGQTPLGARTALLVCPQSQRVVPASSTVCYLDTTGSVIAWLSEDGTTVHFSTGESLARPPLASFDIDPSGHFYVLGETRWKTELGRVADTKHPLVINNELLGERVLAVGNRVYVCGTGPSKVLSATGSDPVVTCLAYDDDGQHFTAVNRYEFPWAAGVCDVDKTGSYLLVQGKRDLSPPLYLYDLHNRARRKVGTAKEFNFLMAADPLKIMLNNPANMNHKGEAH